ncbi:MAG: isoaspartyl peptidase/L-asparaginase [Sphingobacteriaceae bacterium]|nr:isoaspartyl peptidase/L-asparaginase [Sphingobacteriaceae bacterium]
MNQYAIAIHGGAGTILRSIMTPEKETAYNKALEDAIVAGETILKKGGSSLNAVEAAIRTLEDNPLFNAGIGAVFTHDGKNEMDASIMTGKDLMGGACAGVQNIKNPISLARAIMEKSEHVFMAGLGAQEFAKKNNIEFMPDDYFFTEARFEQLKKAKETDSIVMDHNDEKKFGTVGAVALDLQGNLAAGTSTGGMTNKKHGRVGDTPILGAGTYANNNTCAISCTGHGEFFIRSVVAYDISCLMEYKGLSLKQACEKVVMDKLVKIGGEGGLIALDAKGNIELPFNSEGMYRASKKSGGDIYIGIYKD